MFALVYAHTQKAQDSVNCYLSCDLVAFALPYYVSTSNTEAYAKKYIVHPKRARLYTQRRHLLLHCFERNIESLRSFQVVKTSVNKRLLVCTHFFTLLSSAACLASWSGRLVSDLRAEVYLIISQ